MRRLFGFVMIGCLCWFGWWFMLGWGTKTGLAAWFEQQREIGWQADYAELSQSGFPLRNQTRIQDVVLSDTKGGLIMNLPSVDLSAPTYRPADLRVDLPAAPIEFITAQSKSALQVTQGRAQVQLDPSPRLELQGLQGHFAAWDVTSQQGELWRAGASDWTVQQVGDDPETYDFSFSIKDLTPGEVWRSNLKIPQDWAVTFERLDLQARVTFERPWDISAIEQSRPQPRQISLKLAEAKWDELRLFFAGNLEIDPEGVPEGELHIQAENWQMMLDLAQRSNALSPAMTQQISSGLGFLAQMSGNPKSLDVKLTLKGGIAFLGILPLGPAPRIYLR